MKTKIFALALAVAASGAAFTSCQENEFGTVDLTPKDERWIDVTATYVYNHPCIMYTQSEYDRVKQSLNQGTAPQVVKDEFEALKKSKYADKNWVARPVETVYRGASANPENYRLCFEDAAAAYQLSLLWKLTSDESYARTAVAIINDWSKTVKAISGSTDAALCAGAQGMTFANAAENLRDYNGWAAADMERCKTMLLDVFASLNRHFLDGHNDTCDDHYWSNWDLVSLCSYFSIGVFVENNDMVNYVVNYFHNGNGNGCIKNLLRGDHSDPLGSGEIISQNQESGRDQGHALMSCAVASNLAQMAATMHSLNPQVYELDFFGANGNALMHMAEYVALTNLRDGNDMFNTNGLWLCSSDKIPFSRFEYCVDCSCKDKNHSAVHETFADDGGRGNLRTGFELYYHHYAKVKGLSEGYKYLKIAADKVRPECGAGDSYGRYGSNSGAFDQLGWGTLMTYTE